MIVAYRPQAPPAPATVRWDSLLAPQGQLPARVNGARPPRPVRWDRALAR